MKFYANLLLIVFFTVKVNAQNLVLNPSFEDWKIEHKKGYAHHKDLNENLLHWTSPTRASTDYLNNNPEIKPKVASTEFYDYEESSLRAHSGDKMVGIHTYGFGSAAYCDKMTDGEIREYIQGTLKEPLVIGKKYFVRYWVSRSHHKVSTNNVGVYFLTSSIDNDDCYRLQVEPQVNETQVIQMGENNWTAVTGSFVAKDTFQYFIIGNFFSDKETKVEGRLSSWNYFYIDDVFVSEALSKEEIAKLRAAKKNKPPTSIVEKAKSQSTIVLDKVYFKTASSDLEVRSFEQLNELADWLQQFTDQNILIKGHTDNIGNDSYNNKLSTNRAKAVFNYLTKKNISPNRIQYKGFGSARPVADNSTEEGRSKNRRVELEILKK